MFIDEKMAKCKKCGHPLRKRTYRPEYKHANEIQSPIYGNWCCVILSGAGTDNIKYCGCTEPTL